MLAHHVPGLSFVGIIFFLKLRDLRDVMGPMGRNQATNRLSRKVRIRNAEKYGNVVGVGRQLSKCCLLLQGITGDATL